MCFSKIGICKFDCGKNDKIQLRMFVIGVKKKRIYDTVIS